MPRKKGPDLEKLNKIRQVLRKNPNGIWVREIARLAKLDKSTVSIYLAKHMQNEIENVFVTKGNLIKILKLRK